MSARQAFLSNFWVGTKGGLLTTKHIKRMGMAVWLFQYLLRGQTSVNQHGVGVFQYGHPITLGKIADDMSEGEPMPIRTIQKWLATLKRTGYITTEAHSNHGLTIWIANAKDKTKKPRTHHASKALALTSVDKTPYTKRVGSPENSIHESRTEFQNSIHILAQDSSQAVETATDALPIPKGFIPKDLSYYNKPAAAQTAAGDFSLPDSERIQRLENPLTGKERESLHALRLEAGRRLWKSKEEREQAYAVLKADMAARKQATA